MVSIICGAKGSGKTKRIIDAANGSIAKTDGNIIYLSDQPKHSIMIKPVIRFIDSTEYGINSCSAALGFIKGVLASDNDITMVFIDGLARMACMDIPSMEEFYNALSALGEKDCVDFIITVSADSPPEFMQKYLI